LEVNIRTPSAFRDQVERVIPLLLPRGQELLRLAGPTIKALYEASSRLMSIEKANYRNGPVQAFIAGLREDLARLVPPDFLIRYDEKRIVHLIRYIRALMIRAERGAVHLEKALAKGKEVAELCLRHDELCRNLPAYASEEKRRLIEEFGWMIEEYKISLFAQEIKTAYPVSRKRLDAHLGKIDRTV